MEDFAMSQNCKIFILHHTPAAYRKQKLQDDLDKLNLPYPIEWVESFLPEDIKHIKCNIKLTELSLTLKHQYVFEQIVRQKLPYSIVFEDDVDLLSVDNLYRFIEQSIEEINKAQGDMLWIGDAWVGKYTIPKECKQANKLSYFSENCWSRCTHAYIISLQGAKTMLENYNYDYAIDHLFNHVKRQKFLNIGWTEPGLTQKTAEGVWQTIM
jgi:hypothetical protein